MTFGTFLTPLKNIFKIKFNISYYQHNNRADYPYGTMFISISCGVVHLSFSIPPNEIRDFLNRIILGESATYYGDVHVNSFDNYLNLQQNNNAIYVEEEWFTKQLAPQKEVSDIINEFNIVTSIEEASLEFRVKRMTDKLIEFTNKNSNN